MKKIMLPLAAVAMTAMPVVANAADLQRSSQPSKDASELGGGSSVIIAILAAAAVIAGIIVAVDGGDDDDLPVSV